MYRLLITFSFFFNDTATTEIYTLSLHDALPIFVVSINPFVPKPWTPFQWEAMEAIPPLRRKLGWLRRTDRKSTRLNSSHVEISYAVFCLKKKNKESERIATQAM